MRGSLRLDQLGKSEVENFDAAIAQDEDIFRLQVAMHDPAIMGGGQAVRDLRATLDGFALRHRATFQHRPQAFAFEQFGDEIRRAILLADVIDAENVGMIERGDGTRFLLEAAQAVGITGERRGENLERDVAAETRIARAIDLAHSPGPERSKNFIRPEKRSSTERHPVPILVHAACAQGLLCAGGLR